MTNTQDHIQFFLPARYFSRSPNPSTGMRRQTCKDVLFRAFGMGHHASASLMNKRPYGFTILCRPEQFARFIVHRNDIGECINGIKDLEPKIVAAHDDNYGYIAEETGVGRHVVELVLKAAMGSGVKLGIKRSDVDVTGKDTNHWRDFQTRRPYQNKHGQAST